MRKEITLLLSLFFFLMGCASEAPENQAVQASVLPEGKLWSEAERQFILDELDRTTAEIKKETENLGEDQWYFREDEYRWNIAEIIEHLTLQNELHYREITAVSHGPELPEYLAVTQGQDEHFSAYADAPERGQAKWFLQPLGRFSNWRQHMNGFLRARDGLRDFVEATEVDLRKHFTFRNQGGMRPINELKPGDVRDLHQLLLTGIAHTDRHLKQIRNLKKHKQYPKDI